MFCEGVLAPGAYMKRQSVHPSIRLLLQMLDEAYLRKTWHGPNLKGALRGVTAQQAEWRPAAGRHSIAELTLHAAYWKYAVVRRLRGEARHSFPLAGSNWIKCPQPLNAKEWKQMRGLLDYEHRQLREAVSELRAGAPEKKVRMIFGVAYHDVYHAGQIQLLKRLYAVAHARAKPRKV
jgi:DinB superfamily